MGAGHCGLTDATEHSECQRLASNTSSYAIALTVQTPACCDRGDLLALLHQFMENRTYHLAFQHLLDEAFQREDGAFGLHTSATGRHDGTFWSLVGDADPEECLEIIEMCMMSIRGHAHHLRRKIGVYGQL